MEATFSNENLSYVFDFRVDYCLENERVLLRPLKSDDYDLLLPFSENEPQLWRFNAGGAAGADNLKRYIEFAIKRRHEHAEYPFIVLDKLSGQYAGCTRLYDFRFENKTVQIGYTWYGKAYQGTGINKNCKFLLLDFAFANLNMERVGFAANAGNRRSINAMKSIGCTVEGFLRNNSLDAAGNRIDNIVLSILKPEWDRDIKPQWSIKPSSAKATAPYELKDKTNTASYTWGNHCTSHVIADTAGLSVKQELMPPGTKECLHFHEKAIQVFTIISGEAVFYMEEKKVAVASGQSIIIHPGQSHLIANESNELLEFLITSQPSTRLDRVDIEKQTTTQ